MDYDGKRDRWNGYDPSNYQTIVEEFAKVEEVIYLPFKIFSVILTFWIFYLYKCG